MRSKLTLLLLCSSLTAATRYRVLGSPVLADVEKNMWPSHLSDVRVRRKGTSTTSTDFLCSTGRWTMEQGVVIPAMTPQLASCTQIAANGRRYPGACYTTAQLTYDTGVTVIKTDCASSRLQATEMLSRSTDKVFYGLINTCEESQCNKYDEKQQSWGSADIGEVKMTIRAAITAQQRSPPASPADKRCKSSTYDEGYCCNLEARCTSNKTIMYFHHKLSNTCDSFSYNGCGGNPSQLFDTEYACRKKCLTTPPQTNPYESSTRGGDLVETLHYAAPDKETTSTSRATNHRILTRLLLAIVLFV